MLTLWTAILIAAIALTGFWLHTTGPTYNTLVLTLHKFAALGALGVIIAAVVQANRTATLTPSEFIAAVIVGVLFAGAIATGGLISTGNPMPRFVLLLHQITPVVAVFAAGGMFWLLVNRPPIPL